MWTYAAVSVVYKLILTEVDDVATGLEHVPHALCGIKVDCELCARAWENQPQCT